MQTFLPYPSFVASASVLDRQRLGKQRIEAKQILFALQNGGAWANHPAVLMWKGYETALCFYGKAICTAWRAQGYKDQQLDFFEAQATNKSLVLPPWLGNEAFHLSHRSNLLRKAPTHYRQFWTTEPDNLPYVWPSK